MVPRPYGLAAVAQSLVERLEGARRSFHGPAAEVEFRRIAGEQLSGALSDYEGLVGPEEAAEHRAFLEAEVQRTFLPRYTRVALAMNEAEESGFGLGPLGKPVPRMISAALSLLAMAELIRFTAWKPLWVVMVVVGSFPFWPDLAGWLHHRRHARELASLLDDMSRIEEQAKAWIPGSPAALASEEAPIQAGGAKAAAAASRSAYDAAGSKER